RNPWAQRYIMHDLNTLAWPVTRLGEALATLARYCGLVPRERESPEPPEGVAQEDVEALGAWLVMAATWLGLEAEPVEVPYADIESSARGAGPALLRLPSAGPARFLVLLGGRRRSVSILGPDLVVHRLPLPAVCAALCQGLDTPWAADVARLIEEAGVPGRR